MTQFNPLLPITMTASGAVTAERFVTSAGAQVSAAGAAAIGVSRMTVASGEKMTVDTHGTAIIEAGGAIALGAAVKSGADGRALTYDVGTKAGIALQASTGAGQRIEIMTLPAA
ncbi:MAG: DUF2190 family protein [Nitrosomonas sp.]|nr:DUF2190 family protein [Nitrosomonas sp.]